MVAEVDGRLGWGGQEEAAAKQLGEADYEEVAASFGILGYQSMLRRTLRDEKREAEGRKPKPKCAPYLPATIPPSSWPEEARMQSRPTGRQMKVCHRCRCSS